MYNYWFFEWLVSFQYTVKLCVYVNSVVCGHWLTVILCSDRFRGVVCGDGEYCWLVVGTVVSCVVLW